MKLDRINAEIIKTREKMSDLQDRLKDLERQKTEAENTELVAVIRSANLSHQELVDFIRAFKTQGAKAEQRLESPYVPEEQEDIDDDEA